MHDIIAIGDSTVDIFLEIDDVSVLCDMDRDTCRLCISYADKIPVRKLTRVNAVGNAANHAVGVSRLGLGAGLVTIVGNDNAGVEIIATLKKEKVDTKFVSVDARRGTNYSTVLNYKGERTILVYHEHRDYEWEKIPKSPWVYFTSMGEGHESLYADIVRHVHDTKVKFAFNPGTFQLKLGAQVLGPLLQVCDVLFVNKEEARRLIGGDEKTNNHVIDLLEKIRALGPKMVVITDGQHGSYTFDGKEKYYLNIFEAPVVERTGCGDAFGSGFIAALAYGLDMKEAMRWGNVNAAGVIQFIGAQEGLRTKKEITETLAANPDYQPAILTDTLARHGI